MMVSARQLNRATLDRQMLLRRQPVGVVDAVRRVVALQSQSAASPYLAELVAVGGLAAAVRPARAGEIKRLGSGPVVVPLSAEGGARVEVAVRDEDRGLASGRLRLPVTAPEEVARHRTGPGPIGAAASWAARGRGVSHPKRARRGRPGRPYGREVTPDPGVVLVPARFEGAAVTLQIHILPTAANSWLSWRCGYGVCRFAMPTYHHREG
jgi:hypothetical protein